jgi:hypothetical protein
LPEDAQEEARQRARSSLGTKPAAANVISNTKEEKHLHRHRSIADRVGGRLASLPETIPRLTVNISQSCIQPSTVKKPASAEHIVINCQPQELNKKSVLGQILQDGKYASSQNKQSKTTADDHASSDSHLRQMHHHLISILKSAELESLVCPRT